MPKPIYQRIHAPIKVEQTTLNKFLPGLPPVDTTRDYIARHEALGKIQTKRGYTLLVERNNNIEIKERHCLACGRRLLHNGYNERVITLDNGQGTFHFWLHRKQCPACGEIPMDLSALVPPRCRYPENFKRRARLHYMDGLPPRRIRMAMKNDFNETPSLSRITTWINCIQESMRTVLAETPVPSSGRWGYDEIFLKVRGTRSYALTLVDMVNGFIPGTLISSNLGKQPGRRVISAAKRRGACKVDKIVMDGTTNLGSLFQTRGYDKIAIQRCIMHVKWQVIRALKKDAGMKENSMTPLPEKYNPIKRRFYKVIDSPDETRAFINLEILRDMVQRANRPAITSCFNEIQASLPKIIAWQRDLWLPRTNNRIENKHQYLEYYLSFKKRMGSERGAQRVADYRTLGNNFQLYPPYIDQIKQDLAMYKVFSKEAPGDPSLRGAGAHFYHELRCLSRWFGEYQAFWDKNLAIQGR